MEQKPEDRGRTLTPTNGDVTPQRRGQGDILPSSEADQMQA